MQFAATSEQGARWTQRKVVSMKTLLNTETKRVTIAAILLTSNVPFYYSGTVTSLLSALATNFYGLAIYFSWIIPQFSLTSFFHVWKRSPLSICWRICQHSANDLSNFPPAVYLMRFNFITFHLICFFEVLVFFRKPYRGIVGFTSHAFLIATEALQNEWQRRET